MTVMEHSELGEDETYAREDVHYGSPSSGKYDLDLDENAESSARTAVTTDAVPASYPLLSSSSQKSSPTRHSIPLRSTKQPQEVSDLTPCIPEVHRNFQEKDSRTVSINATTWSPESSPFSAPTLSTLPVQSFQSGRYEISDHGQTNVFHFDRTQNVHIGGNATMVVNVFPQGIARVSKPKPKKRYTITNSKKKLNDTNMEMLSSRLGRNWKILARRLGFHDGDIDRLEYDNRSSGLREVIWKMLSEWRERRDGEATLCAIADHLIELKLYDIAQELKEYG